MNKIIQINLAGQAISIDESAYEILKKYLRTLEKHFKNTESGNEILSDIEARISELFHTKLKGNHTFINEQDVTEATELMGSLSDMGVDEEEPAQSPPKENTTSSQYQSKSKKLFRDPEDKILGGVCSGVGAYLGLDVSVVRLITLLFLLFGGLTIIPYIILWIVIPEARTAQDKYRMHGETPDLNDIVDSVRNEANNVASNLKKNSSLEAGLKRIGNVVEEIIRIFAKFFGAGVLAALVVVAVSISIVLIASATGTADMTVNGETFIAPQLFNSIALNWIFSISLLSVVIIPIGTLIYILVQFLFNLTNIVNLKAIFLAWLLSLAVFIGISIYASGDINFDEIRDFQYKIEETTFV
jgi:phage shock protein C